MKRQIKLDKKRKLQKKTNYNKRLILLKGNYPRLVVRKTNKYIIMQIIESKHAQDKILYSVTTRDLLKYGWPENKKGSLKSLAASYLTGLLLGNKSKELKQKIILDTGLIPSTKGSRVYACIKGIVDAGLNINYDKKIIPSKNRIKSNYEFFDAVQDKIGKPRATKKKMENQKPISSQEQSNEDEKIKATEISSDKPIKDVNNKINKEIK